MKTCHIQMDTKTCTKCGETKPREEFYNKSSRCKPCAIAKASEWAEQHKEERRAYLSEYRAAHVEERRAYNTAWKVANPDALINWRKENPERCRKHHDKWVQENKDSFYISQRKSGAKWRKAHPDIECAKVQRRNAIKMHATPSWADHDLIDATYTMAAAMTRLTGIKYHVDHIVPLRSKLVCGLHVGSNLQLLPAKENTSKGNRYWPDMP